MRSCPPVFGKPRAFARFQVCANVGGIDQVAALGRCVALGDLRLDLLTIRSQPGLLFVQQGNSVLDELVHSLVGAALDVLLDQFLNFGAKTNIHVWIIPQGGSEGVPLSGDATLIASPKGKFRDAASHLFFQGLRAR